MFPEIYMNGDKPAKYLVIDKERFSLRTPAYGFGWLLSSVELLEAFDLYDEPLKKLFHLKLPAVVERRIIAHWEMKGYDSNRRYK
jgi:hypothetical protein